MAGTPRTVKAAKRRELAGTVVVSEYFRMGLTREQAAERMHLSPAALDGVRDGDCRISLTKLRRIEGVLDLPGDLLTYVIEGDTARIDTIGETEMRPGLRRVIVTRLERIDAEDFGS